jgi:hypothetical protein
VSINNRWNVGLIDEGNCKKVYRYQSFQAALEKSGIAERSIERTTRMLEQRASQSSQSTPPCYNYPCGADHFHIFSWNVPSIFNRQNDSIIFEVLFNAVNANISPVTYLQSLLRCRDALLHDVGLFVHGLDLPKHRLALKLHVFHFQLVSVGLLRQSKDSEFELLLHRRGLSFERFSLPLQNPESSPHQNGLPYVYSGLYSNRKKQKKLKPHYWIRPLFGIALVLLAVIPGLPGTLAWYGARYALSGLLLFASGALAFGGRLLALYEPNAQK